MKMFLYILGLGSLLLAMLAAISIKSDIQIILAMLGVIGGILGLGIPAILDRLDKLVAQAPAAAEENGKWGSVPPPVPRR